MEMYRDTEEERAKSRNTVDIPAEVKSPVTLEVTGTVDTERRVTKETKQKEF